MRANLLLPFVLWWLDPRTPRFVKHNYLDGPLHDDEANIDGAERFTPIRCAIFTRFRKHNPEQSDGRLGGFMFKTVRGWYGNLTPCWHHLY